MTFNGDQGELKVFDYYTYRRDYMITVIRCSCMMVGGASGLTFQSVVGDDQLVEWVVFGMSGMGDTGCGGGVR